MQIFVTTEQIYGPNARVVTRQCPMSRNLPPGKTSAVACNCVGRCQPITVGKDDPRSDEQIIADVEAGQAVSWSSGNLTRNGEDSGRQESREERRTRRLQPVDSRLGRKQVVLRPGFRPEVRQPPPA